MQKFIQEKLKASIDLKQKIYSNSEILSSIEQITHQLWEVIKSGHSIYFCGNGGSSADAQHLATELSGRFLKDRRAIKAEALGTNMAFTTAVGNDFGFDRIFARSLEALGRPGDALILLSTSGSSSNILAAADQARAMNITSIGLTGENGKKLTNKCDFNVQVPSKVVPRIQEAHLVIGHVICEHLENSLITLHS